MVLYVQVEDIIKEFRIPFNSKEQEKELTDFIYGLSVEKNELEEELEKDDEILKDKILELEEENETLEDEKEKLENKISNLEENLDYIYTENEKEN